MALADTGRAIGAVTRLLQARLLDALSIVPPQAVSIAKVTIGRPEPPAGAGTDRRLNLFLYEVEVDGHLRNTPLDEGQPPPLWLSLHYLLTAFDADGESDTIEAHELLGEAALALQALNFFSLDGLPGPSVQPLVDNPELLKLSFEDASSELLGRVMQGSDEHYRCSIGFEVRPILVAAPLPAAYSLLVGVDYSRDAVIGFDGVHIPVLPSIGPRISAVEPDAFETGDTVTIEGEDLHLDDLSVQLGTVRLSVTSQTPSRLTFRVDPTLEDGSRISAGNHPIVVGQTLSTGRTRKSNVIAAGVRPRLDQAVPSQLARVVPASASSPVRGVVTLSGILLGTADDDVYAAFYRDGRVVRLIDDFDRSGAATPQTEMALTITDDTALEPGDYNLILRVNGQQARNAPVVRMVAP
ncbi:MAG: hypothetical protein A2Z32_03860 [Chloroflexi bacterium RBG_16_69_14]|nr:MAG: hypothetical protein A2Z32_03860 [Chloroflexi bacterium RBG_16_69_14]